MVKKRLMAPVPKVTGRGGRGRRGGEVGGGPYTTGAALVRTLAERPGPPLGAGVVPWVRVVVGGGGSVKRCEEGPEAKGAGEGRVTFPMAVPPEPPAATLLADGSGRNR